MFVFQLSDSEPQLLVPAGFKFYYSVLNLGPKGILVAETAEQCTQGDGYLIPGTADPFGENGDATPVSNYWEDNHPYEALYGIALDADQESPYDTRVKIVPNVA